MADSELPPIEVEMWARIGRNDSMYLIGTLEYPFHGPMNIDEFLRDFAKQILAQAEES